MIQELEILLIAIAVSLDGFWSGFAIGMRQTRMTAIQILLAGAISLPCTSIALLLSIHAASLLPLSFTKWAGAALLFALAIYAFYNALRTAPSDRGAPTAKTLPLTFCVMLGLAVAADASIGAFAIGLHVRHPWTIPPLFAVTHCITILAGNRFAFIGNLSARLLSRFPIVRFVPAAILMVLGGLRVL